MNILKSLLLVLHGAGFVGILVMIGTQLRKASPRVPSGTLHSALTALVSGLGLVAVNVWGLDHDLNAAKIATKFGVLVVILVIILRTHRRAAVAKSVLWGIGALTLLNIALAVVL